MSLAIVYSRGRSGIDAPLVTVEVAAFKQLITYLSHSLLGTLTHKIIGFSKADLHLKEHFILAVVSQKQPNISENHMHKFPAILKGLNDSILLIEKKAISVAEKLNTT